MITFEDLKFTPHLVGDGIHATMDLKNGNTISVIKTPYSYGGKVGLYELAVIDPNGKFLDVQGYLKETNVVDIINKEIGKSKVRMAYDEHFANEEILEEEFDHNSGYVYLYLNGVAIGSMLGGDVEYLVYDEDRDCEKIFKSIEELNEYRK
jgi:hypothetical protein